MLVKRGSASFLDDRNKGDGGWIRIGNLKIRHLISLGIGVAPSPNTLGDS